MELEEFREKLAGLSSKEEITDFCRKFILHGTPYVFRNREDFFYEFRKRIGKQFNIPFHEVYITGSAKLGFSPFKNKTFDLDSDIDVALVSETLFDKIMKSILEFQYQIRRNRQSTNTRELERYREFLEYTAMGWIRPDKLPVSLQIKDLKHEWFTFFDSISYAKSEVGNYKVTAGIFKTYDHLELYTQTGIEDLRHKLIIGSKK